MPARLTLAFALALLLAAPAASAPAAGGAVTGTVATSSAAALLHWTPERRRAAEPLPVPALPGSAGEDAGAAAEVRAAPSYVAATAPGAEAPDLRRGSLVRAAAVGGVDTGASTVFPNSANGVVFGEYRTPIGRELYSCSGSVVSSSSGDVVLTAGHCVVDPETGVSASYLVFIPGYREGQQPYGQWPATEYATTEQWAESAGTADPDEAGDVAMLKLASGGSGASVQSTVGALGIAFNQPRPQTYTQYGYPAEEPYDGEVLYSHTAAYAGADLSFSPPTMRIASDFTAGSSGGPWTVSSGGTPVALSVTDYGYESEPGYLYGPYFGSLAQHVYELITTGRAEGAASAASSESAPTTPSPVATPKAAPVRPRLLSIRRDPGSGTATLRVAVSTAGVLRLSGARIWTAAKQATAATTLALKVRAKGAAAAELRESGSLAVGVQLSFSTTSGTATRSRLLRLTASPRSY